MSRHVGAARGLRGAATWPCVPRRIHAGPAPVFLFFYLNLFIINGKKIENKIGKQFKNPEKIPKNRKFITFNI